MSRVILHIDEDPTLPEGVAAALARAGYELLQSGDAEEVMRWAEERRPVLVLAEIALEGCDAPDLLHGVSEVCDPPPPMLAMTRAASSSPLVGEAIAMGVTEILSKPVAAEELLARILRLAPPPAPTGEVRTPSGSQPVGMVGDLSATPLPELLARLHRRGDTGVLMVKRVRARLAVQIRNGSPVAVSSNRRRSLPRRASAEQLASLAEEDLFEAFRWPEGSYRFVERGRIKPDSARETARDYASLVLAGVLQQSSARQVRERLRKLASLYVSNVEPRRGQVHAFKLDRAQERFLANLGGEATIADILESKLFEERLLYGLWLSGRLELDTIPTLALVEEICAAVDEIAADEEGIGLGRDELITEDDIEIDFDETGIEEDEIEVDDRSAISEDDIENDYDETGIEEDEIEIEIEDDIRRQPVQPVAAEPPRPGPEDTRGELAVTQPKSIREQLRDLSQRVLAVDDFEALNVPVFAPDGQIRSAYQRVLAQIPQEALDSTDAELVGRAARIRDRIEAAYEHLKDPETRRAYALLRREKEQDGGARASAERALEAERWFRKGEQALKNKRYEDAAEGFGMASHLDPEEGEYLAHLGYALYLSKPGEAVVQREAMEHVAQGIKRSPDRPLSYVFLGRILRSRGETDTARKVFRRALRIRPDFRPAQSELRLLEMRDKKGKGLLSKLLKR